MTSPQSEGQDSLNSGDLQIPSPQESRPPRPRTGKGCAKKTTLAQTSADVRRLTMETMAVSFADEFDEIVLENQNRVAAPLRNFFFNLIGFYR
jgi:hypothetical protein